ncbi:adenylate cyclase [Dongia mobilis]|uniref:Adenylate cyclase n=2 Tax=Dongia mobilis TaxID=578943 RepID=A0A4R6WTL6_9PROT|nr:adenylate cyclase [Dongia mobilis]
MSGQVAPVHLDPAAMRGATEYPDAEAVRAQIELMMSRPEFDASARNRRFLSYVVDETLAGRAARIKAYTIALAVFDRGEDFDPLTDPIVRIEASRLRRAIEHYYLTAGKHDRIRVDMPKGSYIPTFSSVAPEEVDSSSVRPPLPAETPRPVPAAMDAGIAAPAWKYRRLAIGLFAALVLALIAVAYVGGRFQGSLPDARGTALERPSIMVLPFENVDIDNRYAYIATGMTYEIISQLTRFEDFFVFGPRNALPHSVTDTPDLTRTPDFVLAGTVQATDRSIRINIMLTEQATGRSLWAWTREETLSPSGIIAATQSISRNIVNVLAQPDGVLLDEFQKEIAHKPSINLSSYQCVISFRTYWRSYARNSFDDTWECLERSIAREPGFAPAYSALALMNVDRYRFGFGGGDAAGTALARAEELARKAEQLEPRSSQPYLALSLSLWFQHRIDESIATAERGLSFNPNNAELMADLGLRYAQLGQWDRALALTNEAYQRDPSAPSGYRAVHFLHAYMTGNYRNALAQAEQMGAATTIYSHVARAAALGQLGELSRAAEAVADILRIDPQYGSNARTDLAKRNMMPDLIEAIVDGLRKAGLAI